MKKAISFVLAALMLVSAVPTALATNDYTQGTQVVYTATGSESYTITVPALLAPGGNGTVTLQGTWADNRIITVTAEPTVTLTNSIKAEDQKVLNVHFDGISEAGSNTGSQTFTEGVSVDDITNALFGTWSGKFNYNVNIENILNYIYDGSTDGYTLGYYMTETGSTPSTGNLYTSKFAVTPGETLYVSFANERYANSVFLDSFCNNVGSFLCYDENENYIGMLKRADFQNVSAGNIQVKTITVPENTRFMVANMGDMYAGNVASYLRISRNPISLNTSYSSVLPSSNNLTGKKYIAFGDSITLGFGAEYVSYADYIAAVNNMTLTVRATGGYTSQQILTEMSNYTSKIESLSANDYVIVGGFVNDPSKEIPLGTLTPNGTTEFDTETSIGALEQLCYNFTTNSNIKAKFGVVLTAQPYGANAYRDNAEYWAAAISVLEKYNIPYINLYSEAIECADGVHPNANGHKDMAALIEAWMNTI